MERLPIPSIDMTLAPSQELPASEPRPRIVCENDKIYSRAMNYDDVANWAYQHHLTHSCRRKRSGITRIYDDPGNDKGIGKRIADAAWRSRNANTSGLLRTINEVRHIDTDALVLDSDGSPLLLIEESANTQDKKRNWASVEFGKLIGVDAVVQISRGRGKDRASQMSTTQVRGRYGTDIQGNYMDLADWCFDRYAIDAPS